MLLTVRQLTVSYGGGRHAVDVVKGVSFDIEEGQSVGLIGESGSGKSAVIHAIAQLPRNVVSQVSGEALLDDRDLLLMRPRDLRALRGVEVGFVGQNPFGYLHPIIPIASQFHHMLRAHGRGRSKAASFDLAARTLESVGIRSPEIVLRGYAHQLSGGMAQRVVIAMSTILRPRILIADEPTTALDPTVQVQILDLLDSLRRDHGTSTLLVTHDLGVVANHCQHAMVMKDGEIVEQGPVQDLFHKPQHAYSKELLLDDLEVR